MGHGAPSQDGLDVGADEGVDVGVGEVEVVSEKPNTASNERPAAFGASAIARMFRGFADGSDTLDAGSRSVAVRSRGFSPTSPSAQSRRPGPASVQSAGRLVQARGCSAVRRRVAPRAMPPSAWTRTVYTTAYSGPDVVTPASSWFMSKRTFAGRPSGTASAAGLISTSGTASVPVAVIAPQHVLRRTVPPSCLLHGCQGGGAAAPGTDSYCQNAGASNVHHSGGGPSFT